jgi:glycosyltransferase involved in cell wall biosynthesis
VRILFCQNHPKRWTWGSPKSVLRLAQELQARGHTVDFVFQDDMPARLSGHRLAFLTFPLFVAQTVLREAHRYDVVDIASGDGWLYGLVQRARRRAPVFVKRVLGLEHLDWEQRQEEARRGLERISPQHRLWFGYFRLHQVEWAARLSDHVLCLCETDRRYIVQRGWQPQVRTSVVAPGVEHCYFSQGNVRPRRDLLFVGSWHPRKGITYLARAFAVAAQQCPDMRLSVAGAGVPAAQVQQAFPPAMRRRVIVLPELSEEQLAELYAGHTAFVFPSLYEGFGMAFLEAMASGTPVVGTPTGGMADLIEDGRNGLIVARRDVPGLAKALERLLGDPAYARSLGEQGRATARTYTWERAARSTLEVYERALSGVRALQCVESLR